MTEIKRCSKCGAMPTFTEYEESVDGNHDTAAKVECRCGNVHRMTWDEFYQAQDSVPSDKRGSAYLSREEIKAINDVVIEAWNREQGEGYTPELHVAGDSELHAAGDRELRRGVAKWVEYVIRDAASYECELVSHMLGITEDELISVAMDIIEKGTGNADE